MKKSIFLILTFLLIAGAAESQVKVNFSLSNPRMENGIFTYDVNATVPAGQTWNAGPTCIRIKYTTVPENSLSVKQDNPATNANLNVSGNSNYAGMTTTSIIGDSAISLNIFNLYLMPSYSFTSGTHTLGSVRWNILDSSGCINTQILPISAIFNELNPLTYGSGWSKTDTAGCIPIGIKQISSKQLPREYKLYQNYPNPFNPMTTIKYDIAKSSEVEIAIYDELGREVVRLVNTKQNPGTYEVTWDASNYSSGLYFYRIKTNDYVQTNKMVLIK
jgi:hypothetical protein